MRRSTLVRGLISIVGAALGIVLAEGLLRAGSPALPSVAALDETGLGWVPGEVGGDCVTHGSGLPPHAGWWDGVARGLSERRGARVRAVNLAVPGASYCGARQQVEEQAAVEPAPDLLIWGVFADDLVQHELLAVQGRPVLLPSAAPPSLRPLVSHSHLANLVWYTLDRRRISARGRRLDPSGPQRFRGAAQEIHAWSSDRGVDLLVLLLPPVGLSGCAVDAHPDHECAWMRADLEQMRMELEAVGIRPLDLRPRFRVGDLAALPDEVQAVAEGRAELALHPDERAHAEIARLVLAELDSRGQP